jgi:hypothetical protein
MPSQAFKNVNHIYIYIEKEIPLNFVAKFVGRFDPEKRKIFMNFQFIE